MPAIKFEKYHGAGNDFVMTDLTESSFRLDEACVKRLCDRRFGIGADGLIAINCSSIADFEMQYYNSDGRLASFCGNGSRCAVAFAYERGIISKKTTLFEAYDGLHRAVITHDTPDNKIVEMQMRDAVASVRDGYILVDTGSPHYVKQVSDIESVDVKAEGARIRYDKSIAPNGTNVDFVAFEGDTLFIRTYERGVEDETLACGTGVTAAAIAASIVRGGEHFVVKARGGELRVSLKRDGLAFSDIRLTGPTCKTFEGVIQV